MNSFLGHATLCDNKECDLFMVQCCSKREQIFKGSRQKEFHFFYMHDTLFQHPHVRLPFYKFAVAVLQFRCG
ncbi:hypothetical protein JHK87_053312 [Glycine soja]|nr:hypothetical protein JHK87_053312 [Glycine soja]